METVAVTEQVQPQLQSHAIVTLIIGKLHVRDDLLQWLKELVSLVGVTALGNLVKKFD